MLATISLPAYAHGQTWPTMLIAYGVITIIIGLLVTVIIYIYKTIRKAIRKKHIYIFLLFEGKKIEVKADVFNKKLLDNWALRLGYDKYEVKSNGKSLSADSSFSPESGQEYEIIQKHA